jgi:acetyl esterase/lipase
MVSVAAQQIIEQMRSQMGAALPSLEEERRGWEAFARSEKLPEGTLVSGVGLNGVECEWVERGDSDSSVVLLVHGGGFTSGSPRTHRKFAAVLSKASGNRVLVPGYRLAPEHPFPAGLDDVVAVYAALVETGVEPTTISFVGDSAGGGLALGATLRLREIGAPLPGSVVLLSPWLDLTLSGPSIEANAKHPNPSKADLQRASQWYLEGADPRDPLASPVFADLTGLPPLLLQAAGNDVLLDDAVTTAERARAAGVAVTLSVAPEMWHVFQMSDCPEARAAVEEIAAFVNNAPSKGESDVVPQEAVRRQ